MVGERGPRRQIGEQRENPLTRHVDLDLGADRSHSRADSRRSDWIGKFASSCRGWVSIEGHYEEGIIFDGTGIHPTGASLHTGSMPGEGTYFCLRCGEPLALHETDPLPECPGCSGSRFRRDSIFASMRDHRGTTTLEAPVPPPAEAPGWLGEARERLSGSGHHLAYQDESDELRTMAIERGWTRIGRSPTADLFLDDPSVSRRHAMLVCEPGRSPKVLDDRSLNGVLVNGRTVELAVLEDGDEIAIGRFRIYLLSA
ncbi:MAG TPA: FHA domain-containing protein [Solirubrobacterales bacterium]|nr:FHA domain-containing protein [Solirubrobacterales bacterium]